MGREELIDRVCEVFNLAGYQLCDKCDIRQVSFDVAARGDDIFMLVKVLSNIEGLNESTARDLRYLATLIHAVPIAVGEKTKDKPLEDDTIYIRYGIPCVSLVTLSDYCIEGIPPLVYAAPGGLYVEIDGILIRSRRLESYHSTSRVLNVTTHYQMFQYHPAIQPHLNERFSLSLPGWGSAFFQRTVHHLTPFHVTTITS